MNSSAENIIINSCQYMPVYLIQNPNFNQVKSFIIPQNNESSQNPASNNLKSFYENSGKIANNLDENVEHKPKILRKVDNSIFGNNLKLASFLAPKNDKSKEHIKPVTNVVLKPAVASPNTTKNVFTTVSKLDTHRKIVKLKNIPNSATTSFQTKKLPKIKPKENTQNVNKHTSVQLIKLGDSYHSLNELNDDQKKIVNHALKIFSKPENTPKEPAYDPVTNTRYIYKVLSPKDLTLVGKKNMLFTQKKNDTKKEIIKKEIEEDVLKKKIEKKDLKPIAQEVCDEPSAIQPVILEAKVTRSGRKVKLPKHHSPEEETPHKPRKKNGTIVSCFQCSSEFSSLYRLQRHYENHPTHIPAKVHSNLFHCLLAIIKSGSEEDRANIFIQQLEQLIAKFKSLLPCLLKKVDGNEGKLCNINDDIGRLFGMNPGKYNLNMDALSCVKDKEGHCRHNPAKSNQSNSDLGNPSQVWTKNKEEQSNCDSKVDDCARINSVVKWPTVSKRNWKQKSQNTNAKKIKIESESNTAIELKMDDLITLTENDTNLQPNNVPHLQNNLNNEPIVNKNLKNLNEPAKKPSHVQFHSAHFDIRSSPIKQSSTVFCKFQIDPEKIPKYEVQVIKPRGIETKFNEVQSSESLNTNISTIFSDCIDIPTKTVSDNNLDFVNKDWTIDVTNEQSENEIKSNTLIEPALLHIIDENLSNKNHVNEENQNDWENNHENQNQSVLNFLESLDSECLSYPTTEIRNNVVDFQLDLY
ncbi:PREDICTED: uncharacterized protein LOC106123270 [Papilio xuthus]|uniref:Uncharacterized protein LOC106123270 n=1 Tax=Papilio xuthus TaxID=66420 RepID=A0AAJ6ZLK1_PAPXU|nr:PREDICTED: uncharacterized protein LOC106123270 [Papilio xuthus]